MQDEQKPATLLRNKRFLAAISVSVLAGIFLMVILAVTAPKAANNETKVGIDMSIKPQQLAGEKTVEQLSNEQKAASKKPTFSSKVTQEDIDYLKKKGLLNNPNEKIAKVSASPNDSRFNAQWALTRMSAPAAWDTSKGNNQIVVAVLDTGVNFNLPEMAGKQVPGYDFIDNDTDASPFDANGAFHSHGTGVASQIAAVTNNNDGMSGVSWHARIMSVRVLGATGSGSFSAILSGIRFAVDNGANIINMSLGAQGIACDAAAQAAIDYAVNRNVVVVIANGNDSSAVSYPANCNNVISVAASDINDQRAEFSNFGAQTDVAAPGVGILLIDANGAFASWNGTSMAAPHVAGQIAIMRAVRPTLTVQQVTNIVRNTADKVPAMNGANFTNQFGFGRININRAILECLN